jgi:hypothetical protein
MEVAMLAALLRMVGRVSDDDVSEDPAEVVQPIDPGPEVRLRSGIGTSGSDAMATAPLDPVGLEGESTEPGSS